MPENIEMRWNPPSDEGFIERVREIFISAFLGKETSGHLGAYSQVSLADLGLKDTNGQGPSVTKQEFILDAVESEISAIKRQETSCLGVYKEGVLIGFISFDVPTFNKERKRREVYIRQFAIDAPLQRSGIGSSVMQHCTEKFEGDCVFILLTRRINTVATRFYEKQGFVINNAIAHAGLNPSYYVGMESPPLYVMQEQYKAPQNLGYILATTGLSVFNKVNGGSGLPSDEKLQKDHHPLSTNDCAAEWGWLENSQCSF